jgi:membrane protein
MGAGRAIEFGREVVEVMREQNITFMAGSIAHAAFLSLFPLLVLLLIIAAAVGNDLLTERIVELSRAYLSPAGEGLVFDALTQASERAGASVIGVVSLLWGMLRIFRGIGTAFDELYESGESGFLEGVIDGLVVFVAITLATLGAGFGAAMLAVGDHPLLQALNPLILVVGLTVAFLPMYYVFPEPDVEVREALPGAVVAAVGWTLMEALFGIYVDLANTVSLYGTMGAVILLLVWLYGSAFMLLAGATVNIVLAGRHGDDIGESSNATAA